MKKKSMITMFVIALMLVLSLTVLSACGKKMYQLTVTGGTGGGEYAEGATVTITANAPETGKEFTSWTIEGVTVDDKTKAEITFTMPANAVTATANYGDKAYLFALENCTADKESAKFGEEVTFTADEVIGKRFDSWNIKGVDDLTGLDLTKSPLTITMPANDINVAAVLEDIDYTVTVTGGTADKATVHYGETVTITANAPDTGKRFTGWTIEGVTVENTSVTELTFTMPAGNVTATANYDFINYTVSVTGGTANKTTAHYGDSVTITAAAPETGKKFTGWTIEGVTVDDKTKTEITFTMPANAVTATANYEYIDYTVTVTDGTAQVNGGVASASVKAHYGDSITITANAPETGKKFKNWTIEGIGASGWDLTQSKLVFKMSTGNVTATANYDFIYYTVTVNGGTVQVNDGVASASVKAHYGEEVTITAEIPTGMSFAGWTLEGVTAETGGFSINFTMPANNVTATAKYVYNNYNVTVNGGTAQVNDGVASASVKAHYGEEVTITAEVPVGKEFVMWSFEGLAPDGLEITNPQLTFTMPANGVTATAELRDLVKSSVTVQGGVAQVGDGTLMTSLEAYCGDTVTLTAYQDPDKTFVKWTIEGIDTEGLDLTQRVLTFTMPENDVTATAEFENVPTDLTFEGDVATSGELWYVNYDSKSFRLPLGSGQDSCTYTIKLSNPAFTFKVYGSDGEVYIDENGEGVKSITIDREDNYTIEVINTGTAANCTLTVTKV